MGEKRRFMLLAVLLAFLLIPLPSMAQTGEKITLSFSGEHLTTIFRKIEKQAHYTFNFKYDDVSQYVATGSIKNKTIQESLDYLLNGKPLKYSINGRIVTITTKKGLLSPKKEIIGYVIDKEHGEPVIGATIRLLGTDNATVTNDKGYFFFPEYTERASIQASYLGMKTTTVAVKPGKMRIVLENESKTLDNVVVTGIFKKSRESYTGAVNTISSDKLQMYRGTNLLQTLKNIDASINFPENSVAGSNPNVLPNLNIRGSSSLPMSVEEFNQNASQTVNTPLIILDGFEISLTKLMDYNDEQIESINILKDAAATAIYGSRGANGVIVVVTKQPKEGKLRASVRAGLTLEIPNLSSYHLINAQQKLQLEKTIGLYTDVKNPMRQNFLDSYYNERLKSVLEGTDIDWMSKPLRNGVGQRYNIQLDGGSNQFKWSAGLGYNGIAGAMKGSERKTVNGDITLIYSVKDFTFRNYTSITSNNAHESPYGSFQNYVDMEPYNNPYDSNGNLIKTFPDLEHISTVGNPLYDATLKSFDKSNYLNVMNNFSIEWLITEGLRMRGSFSVTTNRQESDVFVSPLNSEFTSSTYQTAAGMLRKGRYTYTNSTGDAYAGNLTLSYSHTFAKKHQLYVGLNYNITQNKSRNYGMVGEGFSNEDMNSIGNALQYAQNGAPSGSRDDNRMIGITGNANYTYDNRYYMDLSYRTDGNSKFGKDNRFAPFCSVGIGWNVTNEDWLYDNKWISNLRLRASYGLTGSQDISTESIYTTYLYQSGVRYLGNTAATVAGLGNSDLTWQKTRELNIGLDFGFLKNRITGQFDVYSKTTSNLLSSMDLPLSTGFSNYTANVGELKNNGFELGLNAYILRDHKHQLNLMVGGQLVYDWNEISKLSDAILRQNEEYLAQNAEVSNLLYVGRPSNAIYAVRSLGIDPSTGEELYITKDGRTTTKWKSGDEVYLGSSQPLFRGNFNIMLMWHNLTVNLGFNYHFDGKKYNSTLANRVEVSRSTISQKNVDERVLSARWLNPGDVTFFRNFNDNYSTHSTSRYVFDDDVLEFSSVNVQYRWNSKWLQRTTHLQSILFAINMNDLAYWSTIRQERGTSYPYARNIQASATFNF